MITLAQGLLGHRDNMWAIGRSSLESIRQPTFEKEFKMHIHSKLL